MTMLAQALDESKSIARTHYLLEQWALWNRMEVSGPGYSGFPAARMLGSTVPNPVISDDMAMRISKLIAELIRKDELVGRALKTYYLGNYNYLKLGRVMKIERRKVKLLVEHGLWWIDGKLSAE